MLDDGAPLFSQIADLLSEEIADGVLIEGDRVPSTNELAAYHRINPATAAKGLNMLIDDGLLEKRRGIGMFVAPGARAKLLEVRRRTVRGSLRRAAGGRGQPPRFGNRGASRPHHRFA